jgi:hypothetical protein
MGMSENPEDPMTHFSPRDGEKIRNRWDCWFWKQDHDPSPGLVILTTTRVVALEGIDLTGFWGKLKPHNWLVVVDRDLEELPPIVSRGGDGVMIFFTLAGKNIAFDAEVAGAALSDMEHARTRATGPGATVSHSSREREVIIKEIVKIPCRFCGTLNLQLDRKCSSCGASTG